MGCPNKFPFAPVLLPVPAEASREGKECAASVRWSVLIIAVVTVTEQGFMVRVEDCYDQSGVGILGFQ